MGDTQVVPSNTFENQCSERHVIELLPIRATYVVLCGKIWCERSACNAVEMCKFHENWQGESCSFLCVCKLNYIYVRTMKLGDIFKVENGW